MREPDDIRSAAEDDRLIERVVLQQVLDLHPAQVSVEELIREIAADPGEFAERDAIERAVRDLSRTGLLHRNGEFVFPTRASLHFDELLGR